MPPFDLFPLSLCFMEMVPLLFTVCLLRYMLIAFVVFCLYTEFSSSWNNDSAELPLKCVYDLRLVKIHTQYLYLTNTHIEQFDHG